MVNLAHRRLRWQEMGRRPGQGSGLKAVTLADATDGAISARRRRLHTRGLFRYASLMISRDIRRRIGLLVGGATFSFLLLASCTTRQAIVLHSNGSGSVQFRATISKTLMDASKGLGSGGSTQTQAGEFDIPKIKEVFSKNNSITLTSLSSPKSGVLTGSFTFSDIGKLFQGKGAGIVSFTNTASGHRLSVHITRSNFAQIAHLAGMTNNPLYQMFGPEQNAGTSQSELNQMMVYVLGKSGPAALKASTIDITVTVPGGLVSQQGGVRKGNTVQFRIPLSRLLLLAKPLDYSITFS